MIKNGNLGETTAIGLAKEQIVYSILKKYATRVETQKQYKRWISNGGNGRHDLFGNIAGKTVSMEIKAVGPRSGTANNKIAYFPYDIKCQIEDCNDAADVSILVVCPWTVDMVVPPNTIGLINSGIRKAELYSTDKHKIIVCMLADLENILENINAC